MDPRRVERARDLYLGQAPDAPIPLPVRKLENKLRDEFQVTRRQAQRYIEVVRRRLAVEAQSEDRDAIRAQTDSMLLDAFEIARRGGRANDMVQAAVRRAEVHGAFKREINVNATVHGLIGLLASEANGHDPEHEGPGEPE